MSEDKKDSLFKFKKASKMIGEFDTNSEEEWDILIKREAFDLPYFIHFQKMWNVVEVPEVKDADGNVTTKGITKLPGVKVHYGFIKDDHFICTKENAYSQQSFHQIRKQYIQLLANAIEIGYSKDLNFSGIPVYFMNENQKMPDISDVSASMGQAILPQVLPVNPMLPGKATLPVQPKRNPIKMFTGILRGNGTTQNNP